MARADPVFNLRMPIDMKDELADRAKKNGRSLNAEIVQILEDALHENTWNLEASNTNEMMMIIREQDKLISKYSEVLEKGSEVFKLIASNNKKPT